MARIGSSDLHRTPGGSVGFGWQLQAATQCARQLMAELIGSRKPDMSAPGAIHGLALLASEASRRSLPVSPLAASPQWMFGSRQLSSRWDEPMTESTSTVD